TPPWPGSARSTRRPKVSPSSSSSTAKDRRRGASPSSFRPPAWRAPSPRFSRRRGPSLQSAIAIGSAHREATPGAAPARDAELLRDVAGGDLNALGTLYDRYARDVWRVACRTLGDGADADDV